MELPIKHGDLPSFFVCLPEGTGLLSVSDGHFDAPASPPHRPAGRFGCADRSQLDLPGSMVAAALHVPQEWDQTLGMEDTRPGKPIEKNDVKKH